MLPAVFFLHLIAVGFAQVQSPQCPTNCINSTCTNPPTHRACTYGCIDESYYGGRCETKCPASCLTCYRQYKTNYECGNCVGGYYSTGSTKNCSLTCPPGCTACSSSTNCTACASNYYINNLNMCIQCPEKCKKCASDSNCSECENYYTGELCKDCIDGRYGYDCKLACPFRCKACTSNDVCTVCNEGHYNNEPTVTNCTASPCPSTCSSCISSTECTSCIAGYYSTDAAKTCPNECLPGCEECMSPLTCVNCKPNFIGELCNKCAEGRFGDNCDEHCSDNCVSCTSESECQSCKDGYYSTDCSQHCPSGCLSCINNTNCTACRENYKGTVCEDCVNGRYGPSCSEKCPTTCLNNICRRNGDCLACPPNTSGNACTECSIGLHGIHCDSYCSNGCLNNKCDRYLANCSDGCISNFKGSKCNLCVDGHTGDDCTQLCHVNCEKCNRYNDICTQCKNYFKGDICEQCIPGQYGDTCEQNCPANCNSKECHKSNGTCSPCQPGFYGPTCERECSRNCDSMLCNQNDGDCSNGCVAGFSGDKCCLRTTFCHTCLNNDKCQVCVSGRYGSSCELQCSSACYGHNCMKDNGYCHSCNKNWYGPMCNKACPLVCLNTTSSESSCDQYSGHCIGECVDGYYGDNCNQTCSDYCLNKACNKDGTVCTLGCVSGRQGSFCLEEEDDDPAGPPIAIIAGVCGAVAALVVVAVSVILIRWRRNAWGITKNENDATLNSEDSRGLETETDGVLKKPARPSQSVKQTPEEDEEEESDGVVDDPYYKNYNPKAEYGNIGDIRKIVSVAELEEYLKQTTEDEFREQFKVFPAGLIKAHKEARKQGNISKNRYAGVYPYDENRVKLRGISSDFINASYIDGHNRTSAYIASLGPTNAAMDNFWTFWHMVWQDKVEKIVVLTNLVENTNMKCEQYWPKPKLTETFGSVSVTNLNEDMNAEYTVRIFSVAKGSESRTVTQVHFTAWPDKGVPDNVTSIIEFHNKIKSLKHEMGGPILVHCSAGIGRTGTYIALDILTEEGEDNGQVDIFNCVMTLRQQRVNMVQTPSQYIYLHKAVAHSLTYDSKAVPASKFQEITSATSDDDFRHKFEQLCATMEEMDSDEKESKRKSKNFSTFNRNGGDIPGSRHRPRLFKFQTMGDNDYINAVFIDGFKERNRFIAAQTPLPDTVVDFIKLILQEECDRVVNLEPEALNVKTIGHYLPPDNQSVTHGPFVLSITKLNSPEAYTLRELKVIQDGQRDAKESRVYCFQFNKWPGKANAPSDPGDFLRFIKDVKDRSSKGDKPIIVHCLSGAIKCGLFCAVHNAIEKVQSEQEVSISNIMRHIKHRRRAAFPNKDQMIFCYSAVSEYLKSFDTYSNFDLRM